MVKIRLSKFEFMHRELRELAEPADLHSSYPRAVFRRHDLEKADVAKKERAMEPIKISTIRLVMASSFRLPRRVKMFYCATVI